ncbi:MAG TPA: pilus assembly protein PilM [Candidatus Polarisedimenticolaceae bacterium]|nr:pilus assembly protein PilM [Candidatus Polarisedimenticolaceae bacterium]
MMRISSLLEPLRGLDLERALHLRPRYPAAALEVDRKEMVLVRLRRRGRGKPELEVAEARPLPEQAAGSSIFKPNLGTPEEMASRLRKLLEATGTKPGRLSLVLPDNLAKISLVSLPERPSSARRLDEVLRFKLRRAVPFRLEDAVLTHQVLPGEGAGVTVLVAVMLRGVVEQYERALEAAGVRPGLVDLCTPNLYNLCRPQMTAAAADGGDVGLLNVASGYFTLLIVRNERLVFYRCKSYAAVDGDEDAGTPMPPGPGLDTLMARELTSSLSYWREKLGGQRLSRVLLRAVNGAATEVPPILEGLGVGGVEPIDLSRGLSIPDGLRLAPAVAQRIAPAAGAAVGRA